MERSIKQLIKGFKLKSKGTLKFGDFISYCYHAFDDKVNSKKSSKSINNYNIMRQNLINYLIVNEKKITLELSK